jgi:tRNA A-37 threonylcarbamoyl transferase component Bud32
MKRFREGVTVGGRYTLGDFVAAGGMGDVWKARDTVLDRTVAVKVMRPDMVDEPVFAQRFREEAVLTAGLSHHNIATLYDYGTHESIAYLVMEFVEGRSLSATIRESGPLEPDRVRSILAQVALALAAAHDAGVVHRDVKPANVLLTTDGTVKLTDFGIARATDASGLTRTGETLGTPHYLSPEQALGRAATSASDLYALGVVGHELLTGRRPFDKDTPIATALAHVSEPMPTLPSSIPSDLIAVITRCLAKEPGDRPASGHEVALALGAAPVEVTTTQSNERAAAAADPHPEVKFVDLLVRRPARICVLSSRSAMTAAALADLGHRVSGVTLDPALAEELGEQHPAVTWHAGRLSELTREGLGVSQGFDGILWTEDLVLGLASDQRSAAMRAVAGLCAPRRRVVVEVTAGPDADERAFRDDFLRAGMVPDLVVASWDLRPLTVESQTTITVLSRR